ncbi:SusC/RagA family TonB-linked outer membrane protein [Parabacteroides sp.]
MLKNIKPAGLLLLAGTLGFPGYVSAEVVTAKLKTCISQQYGKVTGTVEDDFGPVTGASVVVKGTTNGSITDMNGHFTLGGVKNGDVIRISFMGYMTQDIKYTGQQAIQVKLTEDTQKLDEVVVTALGLKREQKALGYAVTELKGEDLKSANTISPVAALQGKVAGVEIKQSDGGIFGATKILIRGASTLGGNNQPIYVVDGVILSNDVSSVSSSEYSDDVYVKANDYGNELKNLNPDDFESVSVLRGAAATALYGSRGLNGAVVITTKGGKGTRGIGVSFSQTLGIDHAFKTPDMQYEYGPGAYVGVLDTDGNGSKWDPFQFMVVNGKRTYNGPAGIGWGPKYDGSEIYNYDNTLTTYSPHKNNMLDMYQLGFNTNTNVSVSGGGDKASFYSSLSYKKANSTTENNSFERYSFLIKGTYQITDRIDVAGSVNFVNSKPRNAARNCGEYFANGNQPMIGTHFDVDYFRDKYLGEHGGVADAGRGDLYGNLPSSYKNYWFALDNYETYRKETVIRPTFEVNVKILDWLRFKADGNMNYYYVRGEDKQLGNGYANKGGYYGLSQKTKEEFTVGGAFTADKQIKDFNVGGFLRYEYYNRSQTSLSVSTNGDMVVPGVWSITNCVNTPKYAGKMSDTKRMMSVVFAVNLGWRNQLYLDITGRNDWSSTLVYSIGTGNHSYFYPSVSGSWIASETFRDKMPEWISLAKLRGSWAQVGNDTSPYSINQTYSSGRTEMPDGTTVITNNMQDNIKSLDLKPERKNSWEIGLDFRVLNSRIGLDATYYKENTKDQIMSISIPGISGASTQMVNAGNIENKGVEITLNTIPFQNKDWQWDLDFTYTKNSNKIISLHENVGDNVLLAGQLGGDYRMESVAKVGGDYGTIITNSMPAIDEKTGEKLLGWSKSMRVACETRSGKLEEIGSLTPDFLGSIATTVAYKNWSLHIATDMRFGGMTASYCNLYGQAGGWIKSTLQGRDEAHGGITWTSQYADSKGITYHDGVIPEGIFREGTLVTFVDGTEHDVSGMSYKQLVEEGKLEPSHASAYYVVGSNWSNFTVNDTWFHKLSYVALREISVSYRLPKNCARKVGANNINLMLSARNLGYLYNSLPNNLNPESGRGNDSREFRIRGFEPYTANYMMTINVNF